MVLAIGCALLLCVIVLVHVDCCSSLVGCGFLLLLLMHSSLLLFVVLVVACTCLWLCVVVVGYCVCARCCYGGCWCL